MIIIKNKNKTRNILVVFILTIIVGIIAYCNRSLLQTGAENGRKNIFNYETGQQYQFGNQKGNFLALNNEGLLCINQNGGKVWSIAEQLTNPCMQSEGNFNLIFDRGNRDIAVYNNDSLMWNLKSDQPIITAKVNSKGYTAVVTRDVGYKGRIEIYNNHGEMLYKWQLGENYVIDVDVSPDCNHFAAATLITNDAAVSSNISVVDINQEKVIGETKRSDSLVINIKYRADGSIVAVGDKELAGISSKGEEKWIVDFEGRGIQKFKLPYDTSCVLTFAGSRNNSILEVYGGDGKKTGEYISESEIKALDISDKTITVSEKRNILLLNLKGKVTTKKEVPIEIHDVEFLTQGKVAVIGSNSVEIVKP